MTGSSFSGKENFISALLREGYEAPTANDLKHTVKTSGYHQTVSQVGEGQRGTER